MDQATARRGTAGLSLVELLVVLGIIGIISAVLVPVAIQGGWFSGSKTAFAARELFTLEKAARVYASTYNVETAVAYGGVLVKDSELAGNPCVPMVDTVILARRLKREELIAINLAAPGTFPDLSTTNDFVPLDSSDGAFRALPKQMALPPDFFAVDGPDADGNYVSRIGLSGIRLYDVEALGFLEPRYDTCSDPAPVDPALDYKMDALPLLSFPAHRFLSDGSMRVSDSFAKQRFSLRVTARPDAVYKDRFFANPDTDVITPRTINIVFNEGDAATPTPVDVNVVDDADPDTVDYVDVATSLEFFVPTGRVKLVP